MAHVLVDHSARTGRSRRAVAAVVALLLCVGLAATAVTFLSKRVGADVNTAANDNLRTGWYPNQSTLSPASVADTSNFGQLYSLPVTGQVYAQPVVSNNVLVVATEHNQVYGFNPATQAQLWTKNFGPTFDARTLNNCSDISPEVGVTSTPVVDPATKTVYVMSKAYLNGSTTVGYYLHALDVATGAEKPNFPVQIQGTADDDPSVAFNAKYQLQRPGLLLMNGVVYAAFSGHCDAGLYQGWISGVSTSGTLKAMWSDEAGPNADTDDGPGGGIWMSGSGLVSDKSGDIVFSTGNGTTPPAGPASTSTQTLGQAEVRLRVQTDGTLKLVDYFSPYDGVALNSTDSDVGSGGVLALPSQYFGTPSHPHLLVSAGKQQYLWLMDADNMGGVGQGPQGSDNVLSRVGPLGGGLRGKPSAWPGDGGYVYLATSQAGAGTGRLNAFKYGVDGNGVPTLANAGQSADLFGFGSGSPVITSDGTTSGSALLWTTWFPPTGGGTGAELRAYNAVPVNGAMQLVRSFPLGTGTKFSVPAVDNGRLYVGTADGHVLAFGSPITAPLSGSTVSFPKTVVGSTSSATATVIAAAALTVTGVTSNSALFTVGTPSTPALPATIAAGGTFKVPVQFKPTASGQAAGTLTFATSAGPAVLTVTGAGQVPGAQLTQYPCCLSFGGAVAGGPSRSSTVSFTSTGASPLVIQSYELPSTPFTVTGLPPIGASYASGQGFTATFTFAPTTVGVFTDYFKIGTNDPTANGGSINENPAAGGVTLSGTGGTQPVMRLTPQNLNYGSVPVGVTATQSFTLTNTGGTDLNITISKVPAGDFSAQTELPESSVIPAGQTVTERVKFTPTATGTRTSSWAITGDDGAGRQDVNLTGVGTAPAIPSLAIGDLDVNRPTTGTVIANVPVTLDAPSASPVTVSYATKDGTATVAGSDYVTATGSLTFAPGETAKTVPVTVNGAQPTAVAETLTANLTNVTGAALLDGSAKLYLTGTYLPVSVRADDTSVPAAASGPSTLAFPVTVSPAPYPGQPVTVKVATADGTAIAANGDYTPVNTTLTFTATTASQTVTVPVSNRPTAGASKTVSLVLSNSSTGSNIGDTTAIGTVYNGTAPLSSLYVGDVAVLRPASGNVGAAFTIRLSPASTKLVPVSYGASGGGGGLTAADYDFTKGNLNFQPGETTKTIIVPVHGSATSTGTGTFNFNLSDQSNATLGDPGSKAYVVSPLVHAFASVHPASAWVSPSEDTTVNVPITLNASSANPVTVTATTSDGTATAGTDYASTTASITIPAGSSSAVLPVTVLHHAGVQPVKKFNVILSGASGVTQISSGTASVTLLSHTADATVPAQNSAPLFTASTPPASVQGGAAYSYTFAASGVPNPSFAVATGKLPPGLTLNAVTGQLSGTPTTGGAYTFTVSANNNVGSPATTPALTITVSAAAAAPSFTASSPPSPVTQNSAYSYQFAASGNPAPTFAVASGSLPTGTSLSSSGSLSGAPTAAGTYTFTVSATNGVGSPAVTGSLSISVNPAQTAPAFTAASPNPNATMSSAYSYNFAASGSPAPTFALATGSLPTGLSLSGAGSLSGTPSAAGTFHFTVRATNPAGNALTPTLTITVSASSASPVFTAANPGPNATVNTAYSYTFAASGSPAPTFAVASGALPAGLVLSATGAVTGKPTAAGTFTFTVKAVNSIGNATTGQLTITVAAATAAPVFTAKTPATAGSVGTAYSYTFAASGNPAPSFAVASGTVPTGLSLNSSSGALAGTPTAAGTFTFAVQASNGVGVNAVTPAITITVSAAASGGANLGVTISGPSGVKLGSTLTWSLNIANTGPSKALSINGRIAIPSGMTFSSATSGYVISNGIVSWTQASLSSGSAIHWKLVLTPTAKGTFTTTGSASSSVADPVPGNNTATSAPVPVK